MCASARVFRCGRKARVPCTTPQKLMSNSHSICAWSISSNGPISATPALLTTMPSAGCAAIASRANCAMSSGAPTSTRCTLTLRAGSDLGRERLQPGLVAIGQREIAAALRKLDCQRAADAARRSSKAGKTTLVYWAAVLSKPASNSHP